MTETKTIELGGKAWEIPELAIKQNRVIVPAVMRLKELDIFNITVEQFDDLTLICRKAMTRAYPAMTDEEFDALPITLSELVKAFPVVADQAGMRMPKEGTPPSGEAEAGSPSTGTSSSQESA